MESLVIIFAFALASAWALAYKRANGLAWSLWLAALVAALQFGTGTPCGYTECGYERESQARNYTTSDGSSSRLSCLQRVALDQRGRAGAARG